MRQNGGVQKKDRAVASQGREGVSVLTPDQHRRTPEGNGSTDGDDDQGKEVTVARVPDRSLFESHAEGGHRCNGEHKRQRHGKTGNLAERDRQQCPDHDEITLHEVHQPRGILDEAISQGDERINAPVRDP